MAVKPWLPSESSSDEKLLTWHATFDLYVFLHLKAYYKH